jgi:hypothetical protein
MYWKKIKRKYKFKIYFPNGLDPQPDPATVNRASFPLNRCVPSSTPTVAMPGIPVVSSRQRHPAARPLARPCHYPSTPCGSPTPCRAMASAAPFAHVGRPMPAHLAWSVDKQRPDKLLPNHRPLQGSRPCSPTSAHPSAMSTHVHWLP